MSEEGTTPDEPPTPPEPPNCTVCGSGLEADQTYCLECGTPTPAAPRLRSGGRTAAVLAGAMIVLGLGAGALAYAVAKDDGSDSPGGGASVTGPLDPAGTASTVPLAPETAPTVGSLPADPSATIPSTSPPPGTPGTQSGFNTVTGPGATPTTDAQTTGSTTTEQTPPTSVPGASTTGDSDWPSGRTAWTAILSSVRNEADARAAKGRVADGGDPAGVLLSTDFSDLRAGYWVVFSGIYGARATAIAQATKLRSAYPTAYARQIQG